MSEFPKGRRNHTREELNEVAERARSGDEAAKAELGTMMQPILIGYLRTIGGSYTREQRDEMTQEAWLGVWHALERWPNDGRKFSGYAYHWMRHFVMEWVATNTRSTRLPRKSWHYGLKLAEAWRRETGDDQAELWDASPEQLRALEVEVERDGQAVTLTLDGGPNGRSIDAVDVVRALRQSYSIDPDFDAPGSRPAEDDHFDEAHSIDEDALDAHKAIENHLANKQEDIAYSIALDFIDKHDLPIEVADRLIEEGRK